MTGRGVILFALLSVLWGIPYLLIKVAITEIPLPLLVFARSAIGAIALLPIALAQGGFDRLRGRWPAILAFSVIEMVIPWGLIAHGEASIDSSTAGLLIALTPIVTVILSNLTGPGEPIGSRRWLGLFLGLAGVFVLAAPAAGGSLLAICAVLLAAVCYAAGSIIASRWLKDIPAAALTVICLVIAALVYVAPAAYAWPASMPSNAALAATVGLGVFCTGLAFAAFFLLVREAGPERAVVITYVAPAVAVAAGVLLLSEPLDAWRLAAFALILCGSYLATARGRLKRRLDLGQSRVEQPERKKRMAGHALFIQHKTRPGMRDAVQRIWQKHMEPSIALNPDHEAYFYCFGEGPDTICAFQRYSSREAAAAFVKTPEYAAYQAEIAPLLQSEPAVIVLDVQWSKQA